MRCPMLIILCFVISGVSSNKYNITNILMIVIDDLRPEIGAFVDTDDAYYPGIQTPNLDSLATESIVFKQAYAQYPKCGPSRASLLTGRRVDTTGVYDNHWYWRQKGGNFTTLPEYFKDNGYLTYASGKVFHNYDMDDKYSWTEPNYAPTTRDFWDRSGLSWGIADPDITRIIPLPCTQIKDYAVDTLQKLSNQSQPFFLAVGIQKPHLPFVVPPEFYDMHPEEDIYLPDNPHVPLNHPEVAWSSWNDLATYDDIGVYDNSYNQSLPDNKTIDLRRGYYASVSYSDSLVGEILQELDNLFLSDNTAILFFSDHGWQLGEHSDWAKNTNFYLDTHVPMMLKIPGITNDGMISNALVENVDIFSTLVDIAGLPELDQCPEDSSKIKLCHEGFSMAALISEPDDEWKTATFSQVLRDEYSMGYAIHTFEYNYGKWISYSNETETVDWDNVIAEELFDLLHDPNETENVAGYPEYREIQREMEDRLMAGWRAALPS